MHPFHAHIYFDPENVALAAQVRQDIAHAMPYVTYLGELIPRPIGPHTKPMFEIHIPAAEVDDAMSILENKRRGLSVLIHPVQANELEAHTDLARWLGVPLALKLEILPRN